MKQRHILLKVAALVSSVSLAGGFVAVRAGVFRTPISMAIPHSGAGEMNAILSGAHDVSANSVPSFTENVGRIPVDDGSQAPPPSHPDATLPAIDEQTLATMAGSKSVVISWPTATWSGPPVVTRGNSSGIELITPTATSITTMAGSKSGVITWTPGPIFSNGTGFLFESPPLPERTETSPVMSGSKTTIVDWTSMQKGLKNIQPVVVPGTDRAGH